MTVMLQYCRYCGNMICGDANYCREKKRFFSDKQICAANKCKYFDFNPIDALGINKNEYRPREKTASEDGQMNFFESEE